MKQFLHVVVFILCSSSFVHAQTIADLARQERAKRQNAPKALVITNKDLKGASNSDTGEKPPDATAPPASPAAAATPAETPEPPAPSQNPVTPAGPGGHDENWWRAQFDKVRAEIRRLETEMPLLESNLSTANREFLTRAYDPDGRGKRAIDEAKARVDQAKSDLAKARERLPQLEDDLRRAGGPAGWAR